MGAAVDGGRGTGDAYPQFKILEERPPEIAF